MKSKVEIAKQFAKHKGITDRGLTRQRDNSALCHAFVVADYIDKAKDRYNVQIDKVSPYINAVTGFAIQNRQKAKYVAMVEGEQDQEIYSKNANILKTSVLKKARADQVKTQQDRNLFIQGYGAVETAMTYGEGYATTDPNGEILMDDVTPDVGWDPMARKPNLLDSRWTFYRKSYELGEAKKLFDEGDDDDFEKRKEDEPGFTYEPGIQPYDRSRILPAYDWNCKEEDTVWVYFYQWAETETFYRADNPVYKLTNPLAVEQAMILMDEIEATSKAEDSLFRFDPTAERLTFDGEVKKKLEEQFDDLIKCYEYPRKVFYTAVLSGDKVFKAYRSISQKGFSVKFKTGMWDAKNKIWYGMVNPMMEPMRYFNKSLTELMKIIDANSNTGVLYEETAVEDPDAFEASYGKKNTATRVLQGGINGIQPKGRPFQPTGYEQIVTLSDQSVSAVNGFEISALVSANNDMNGILHRQVLKQVKSILAPYFDSIEAFEEEHARFLLDYLRVFVENNVGGTISIIGEKSQKEFLRITQDSLASDYFVDIQPAPETAEEQQEQAQIFIGMGDKLLAVGDPSYKAFYAGGVKLLPLDIEHKNEMLQALQAPEDPRIAQLQGQLQQLMSVQQDLQNKLIATQTQKIQTDIDKNMAAVQKTSAEIGQILQNTDQTILENQLARAVPAENLRVTV